MDVQIRNLKKVYGDSITALAGVNLDIGQGMFGLLGPNGAGKTTMMRIIATLLDPTEGEVRVGSYDVRKDRDEIRKMLGYLSQEFSSYPKARVREFVQYIARLNGLGGTELKESVERALKSVGLASLGDRKVSKLSGGMVRRLGVAQALVGRPKLLIVDEPTVGLDPEERIKFRSLLQDLEGDVTVILSTHIVADISSTCTGIALLDRGRIIFTGSPAELLKKAEGKTWEMEVDGTRIEEIKKKFNIVTTSGKADKMKVRIVGEAAQEASMRPVNPTLEDAYIYFIEREGAKGGAAARA
jgi:ABC-2 type transport system ATP-binding protein